ncbi:malonyl-ACP O-methyltransferase BioC [Acinetobacter soli]|uniref:malonyl-ACP O-methyltransferase BioC n=1 Tax=Acinetobacter soli TaxID=487316 RepID=UPI00148F2D75|nr:malonyl-ACP O-methyltransferase BioC [Acinetobacter soli]MEB4801038.1 malonyl-ACP O-methyltransferase BioC [Acinetobacter soli]
MFVKLDKTRIAQRFAKAGQSYVEQAVVQKAISQKLAELMQQYCPATLPHVFEIGCGSGNLTHHVLANFAISRLYLNDLYADVQQHFLDEQPITWYIGDIEHIDLPTAIDAVISSSAVQWVHDLPQLLQRCHDALQPGAWLCLSSFAPLNFTQIKQLTGQGLSYWSRQDWQVQLQRAGFECVYLEDELLEMYFDTPKAVLKHLKLTGVTGTTQGNQPHWTKGSLHKFYQDYQQFQNNEGLYPLTYHPLYCLARRTT